MKYVSSDMCIFHTIYSGSKSLLQYVYMPGKKNIRDCHLVDMQKKVERKKGRKEWASFFPLFYKSWFAGHEIKPRFSFSLKGNSDWDQI